MPKLKGELTFADGVPVKSQGQYIFDYIDIEEKLDEKDENEVVPQSIAQQIKAISQSFSKMEINEYCQALRESSQAAHLECRKFAEEFCDYTEKNFMEIFNHARPLIFIDFVDCLLAANTGPMLNNFDLFHFSMPLEFNPEINFQLVYAVRLFLTSSAYS